MGPPRTPPPTPPFPLLTLDGLTTLVLRPLTNPLFTLLPPLLILSLDPTPSSPAFRAACLFTLTTLVLQLLAFLNGRFAGGPPRPLDWTAEVVLITGGAGGLGRTLAEYYGGIRRCATVVVDVLPASEERRGEWEALGCAYYECDVSDFEAVRKLQGRVEREVGRVSVLMLAAGVVNSKGLLEVGRREVERCVGVNLLGAVWCVKAFLPGMVGVEEDGGVRDEGTKEDGDSDDEAAVGGTIVTVSSVLGYLGGAGLADYTATKAALTALHESLKAELNIQAAGNVNARRVNTILATPGQMSTPLFAHVPPPPLASFLGPTVTPAALTAEIIRAVDEGRDKEISLPLYAQWIGALKVLPAGLAKLMRNAVGLDWAAWEGTKRSRTSA